MDWSRWSQEAVATVSVMNDRWMDRYELHGAKYVWNLDEGLLRFEVGHRSVEASLCVVGTASDSDDGFLWGWANDSLPRSVTRALDRVRAFGEEHDLPLLTTGKLSGGSAQGKECAALAARILDADGVFLDRADNITMFFVLANFRETSVGVVG